MELLAVFIALGGWLIPFAIPGWIRSARAARERRLEQTPGTPQHAASMERLRQLQEEAERKRAEKEALDAVWKRNREEAIQRAKERGTYVKDWKSAERAIAVWMAEAGFMDVKRGPGARDGGIDVMAKGVAAQVKYWPGKKVGRPAVQQLKGAAGRRRAVFFAFGTQPYTLEGFTWASRNAVSLFTFDSHGNVRAANDFASALIPPSGDGLDEEPG